MCLAENLFSLSELCPQVWTNVKKLWAAWEANKNWHPKSCLELVRRGLHLQSMSKFCNILQRQFLKIKFNCPRYLKYIRGEFKKKNDILKADSLSILQAGQISPCVLNKSQNRFVTFQRIPSLSINSKIVGSPHPAKSEWNRCCRFNFDTYPVWSDGNLRDDKTEKWHWQKEFLFQFL